MDLHSSGEGKAPTPEWARHAESWIRWAREPGHDSYWRFHRDEFLPIVPEPPARVLDLGCGEGRLSRDLRERGYQVTSVDSSELLVRAAKDADRDGAYLVCDAARLPFREGCFDVVAAFMSLMDVDDLDASVAESVRSLDVDGRLCIAVVHPVNSAGSFEDVDDPGSPFVIEGDYLGSWDYTDTVERDGLTMTFTSIHRPLGAWFSLLVSHGLVVDQLREVTENEGSVRRGHSRRPWTRLPMFLHLRALRHPAQARERSDAGTSPTRRVDRL